MKELSNLTRALQTWLLVLLKKIVSHINLRYEKMRDELSTVVILVTFHFP